MFTLQLDHLDGFQSAHFAFSQLAPKPFRSNKNPILSVCSQRKKNRFLIFPVTTYAERNI